MWQPWHQNRPDLQILKLGVFSSWEMHVMSIVPEDRTMCRRSNFMSISYTGGSFSVVAFVDPPMMSHDARVQKIVEALRSRAGKEGWEPLHIPCVGTVYPHVMSEAVAKEMQVNEVWVRIGSPEFTKASFEFRGSAEKAAKELCKLLRAPSKAIGEVAKTLAGKAFDGLREPEMAAMFGLDEDTVFRAMALLGDRGIAISHGDRGWFRPSV